MSLYSFWTQIFPPRNGALLTEANLPSQNAKVYIVTGGSSGLGYELSRILYGAGAKVYILTRSKEHAESAISRIRGYYAANSAEHQTQSPTRGSLVFVSMDLEDFNTVKAAAEGFLQLEGPDGRLDGLFNNAGTGARSNAPPSRQGHEYHFSTNSIGHFLLTRLLMPILSKTASSSPSDSVRVVWSASLLVDAMAPKGGIRKEFLENTQIVKDPYELYAMTKTASWFLASEFARREGSTGVVHLAGNPGNYDTNIWRHVPRLVYYLNWPILRNPVHGAETYLWMGLSGSITMDDAVSGRYAICDGRWHPGQREDILLALRTADEGGTGLASQYFNWCDKIVEDFLH